MSGVQIGRVMELKLLQPTGVQVKAEIDSGRTILDCDACWITSASVLGDSVIEFVPPDRVPQGAKPIEDGTEIINGRVASNPLEAFTNIEPSLQAAMRSVSEAGTEVTIAARNLNATVVNNQDQVPRIAEKAELALDQFIGPDPNGGALPVFDQATWTTAAQNNPSWDAATWTTATWTTATWTTATWTTASWEAATCTSATWTTATWTTATWTTATWTTASDATWTTSAESEANATNGEFYNPAELAAAQADLGITPSP